MQKALLFVEINKFLSERVPYKCKNYFCKMLYSNIIFWVCCW